MATQQDLQELLRLQTARKMPMKDAMAQIKALQGANLRSVQQIADAPLKTVETAMGDTKAARSLQNACKAHLKRMQTSPTPAGATGKRPAAGAGSAAQDQARKRARLSDGDGYMLGPADVSPEELEASLSLPLDTDEDRIAETAIQTNRAPLVLAFAVELLRHTMPEQPPSSRLSLAQAVVSANSRSKAVSLGLDKGPSADEEGWGEGQPRIKVMGREIAVLKRGGYQWKGEEEERAGQSEDTGGKDTTQNEPDGSASTLKAEDDSTEIAPQTANTWTTSPSVSLKQSTFVARAISITDPSQRSKLLKSLFEAQPGLRSASHNVWAYRIRASEKAISNYPREASDDDGESGAGALLLRILRETNTMDTLVVMTRWYGGIMLGPDRWRLMRNVVTQALSERLRRTGIEASLGGEAVWGLDLEGIKSKAKTSPAGGGMLTHRPEAARNYLLKSFASAPAEAGAGGAAAGSSIPAKKKTSVKAENAEKEDNLGLLLGALRLLFDSWADFLSAEELDRRAWGWYAAVRPEVDSGPSGWGAKGTLRLKTILGLRRKPS